MALYAGTACFKTVIMPYYVSMLGLLCPKNPELVKSMCHI